MSTDNERLQQLEEAYRRLWKQHTALKEEIQEQYREFKTFREHFGVPEASAPLESVPDVVASPVKTIEETTVSPITQPAVPASVQPVRPAAAKKPAAKSSWEQYIGEQLLSKIGIAILIIGVGVGAKYAIDHDLTTPVMRITGGYVIAAILGFFAYRFREKYNAFSAVLMSGSMAVTYFITYAGFSFYHLYPYGVAFVLLLLTTAGTVYSALKYNQVVIAHIGLVGAYILPVLIAQQTAHFSNYLAYMALINGGILFISFLRDWRSLYYVAFGWTSFVQIIWFFTSYHEAGDAPLAMAYATGYFALFHTTVLAYPLLKKRTFHGQDLFLIIPNVLVFLGIGHYILYAADANSHSGFIFGIAITAVFFLLWAVFRKIRPEDELVQQTHLVVALSVLTLSFLLELEGPVLLFILVLEVCVLTWLALKSSWKTLGTFSLIILCVAAVCYLFAFDNYFFERYTSPFLSQPYLVLLATVAIPLAGYAFLRKTFPETRSSFLVVNGLAVFFLVGFFLLTLSELNVLHYSKWLTRGPQQSPDSNAESGMLMSAFIALYWVAFVAANNRYFHFKNATSWIQLLSVAVVLVVLLYSTTLSMFYAPASPSLLYFAARYAAVAAVVVLLLKALRVNPANGLMVTLFHISLLWILSLEMTHWLTMSGNGNAYRLSLSILWGAYAIYILFTGMKRNIAPLRVTSMIILAITLVKLFFYDLVRLSTISKTIVLIALGGLLLIGAYFYQRYKASEEQPEDDKPN